MAAEISLLTPDFRKQLLKTLAKCKEEKGIAMEVIATIVTPLEQAALWKQGRTKTDAELKVLALENAKAPFLAECLRTAQPLGTNLVTDLLPGMDWHQWGEAATVVWVDGIGQLKWAGKDRWGKSGYTILAEEAKNFSIVSGSEFIDCDSAWRELQLRKERYPNQVYDIVQIDAEMKRRFFR